MSDAIFKILIDADVKEANDAIKKFQDTLKQTNDSANKAGSGVKNFTDASSKATNTLANFNRVVSDAPFGLIGIANNIDPLISSFQSLSATTKDSGGPLKALGAALTGPAGIALAISTVTSVLIAFGPEIKAFINGTVTATEAQKELNKSVAEFGDKAAELAGKQIAELDSLIAGTQNLNLSQQQRLFYVDELQKKYPAYFGNLSREAILAGDTDEAYKKLTASLIQAAKARAAQDILSKIAAEQLKIEEQKAKLQTFNSFVQSGIEQTRKENAKEAIKDDRLALGISRQKLAAQQKERAQTAELDKQLASLSAQAQFYIKTIQDGAGATADLGDKGDKAAKKVKKSVDEQKRSYEELFAITTIADKEGTTAQQIQFALDQQRNKELKDRIAGLNELIKIQSQGVSVDEGGVNAAIKSFRQFEKTQEEGQNQQKNSALKIIEQDVKDATAAFSLLSPTIDAAFNSLSNGTNIADAVGQAIKDLVIQLIKAVAQAAILSGILSIIGGPTALVNEGGFGGIFGKLLGFRANGGGVLGNKPYIVGERGPELFLPNTSGSIVPNMALAGGGGGNVSFEIRGDVLYGLLRRTANNKMANFG